MVDKTKLKQRIFNSKSLAGLIGVIGLAVGAWIGSAATACQGQKECSPSPDMIEAIGTWVGGLGTMAAVLVAVIAFLAEREEWAQAQFETLQAQRDEAGLVTVYARSVESGSTIIGCDLFVRNLSREPIHEIWIRVEGAGRAQLQKPRLTDSDGERSLRMAATGNRAIDFWDESWSEMPTTDAVALVNTLLSVNFKMGRHYWRRTQSGVESAGWRDL